MANYRETKRYTDRMLGAVVVEFMLVLPLLLAVVLMLFDLGQRQYYSTLFSAAAERATSHAAVVPNLEYVDEDNLDGEPLVVEIKERALSILQSAGIEVHLGAWAGGESFDEGDNGSPPAWVWINDIQVILPEDPDGTKPLLDMLASEPIIIEMEGFYARTITGFGPSRIFTRRATYREMSENVSNPLSADAERPCPGAIDNRYGFANGSCYCRLDSTGLTDSDGGCDCANQLQTYNPVSGKCECPAAPPNSTINKTTCEVTCKNKWATGADGLICQTCSPPFSSADPISGGCACSSSQRAACHEIPGKYDTADCTCTKCPGSDGAEERYATNGSCNCKSASVLCMDDRMTVDKRDGCSCECPNSFFDIVDDTCECNVDRLIDTCGDEQYINTETCSCTNCAQAGAERDEDDPTVCRCAPCIGGTFKSGSDGSTRCAECVSCGDDSFEGDWEANPDYDGSGNPCICPLDCEGNNQYLNEENNGTEGGVCECLSCEGQAVANEENTGCYCDKATLYNECVANPGVDGQLEFDPQTACDCGAPCPRDFVVNPDSGRCECPQSKVDGTECPEGSVFVRSKCRCVAECDDDGSTDDTGSGCFCDHEAKRAECHAIEMPYSESTCSCAGNCWDLDSRYPHWDPALSRCFCDKEKYIADNELDCNGKVWSQDSCSCGTASCTGSTPDYDGETYSCICNKSDKEAACKTGELQWDASRCDCGEPCPPSDPLYDPDTMGCGCPAERVQGCIDLGKEFDPENCTCGGNCSEQEGANDVDETGNCFCDRQKNIDECLNEDPPQQIGSACGCGGTCGGTTPDLVDGACVCNRNWANGNGEGESCSADEYFDPATCRCQTCGDHAAPGDDANHSCECTATGCPYGMIAEPVNATNCECVCPEGTEEVAGSPFENKCMPLWCNRNCIWEDGEWRNPGTE